MLALKLIFGCLQYEGDLYILATDQGYINQPDLVWEKLNEVRILSGVYFNFNYFTVDGLISVDNIKACK